jgi:UDP-glucose 4-epimerase
VGGTVAVMEAMRDAGVKRVVFTSSGAVYGDQEQQPVCEDFPPDPGSPYAASKVSAEHYVRTIGKLWGIETVILRVFNAYGPGQAVPPAHAPVIPQLLKQALGGGSLVVFGDGRQSRDFVYVEDVVDGLTAAATAKNIDRQIINIGSGTEVSINAITDKIGRVTGRKVSVLHSGAQTGGVSRLCANITQARQLLGFAPQVDLDTGLKLTLEGDPQFKPVQRG